MFFARLTKLRAGAWLACAWLTTAASAQSFEPCDDAGSAALLQGSLCARQPMPLDHQRPEGESISLFIRKYPAVDRASKPAAGELWLLSGGPGESGAVLYPFVDRLRSSFPGFDIIVPDHRGTGFSSRLCPREEAVDGPGGAALTGGEWASCWQQLNAASERTRQFTLSQAARDLRGLLTARPAGPPIFLYAVSYGTQLVLRALQFGPMPVRGAVLDSLVPPENDSQWDLSRRSIHVDDVGRQVLARCDADAPCREKLAESAALSLQRVLDVFDAGGLAPGLLSDLQGQDLRQFLGQLLDVPAARTYIPAIIQELETGSGDAMQMAKAALQTAGREFPDLPQMPASMPLAALISGSENNLRPDLSLGAVRQSNRRLLFSSPLPEKLVEPGLPMYARDKLYGRPLPATSRVPPLLVLSGSLDPKTPLAGARKHVAALRATTSVSWVRVQDAPHFVLWTAPGCFASEVRRFLQGDAPAQADCAESP